MKLHVLITVALMMVAFVFAAQGQNEKGDATKGNAKQADDKKQPTAKEVEDALRAKLQPKPGNGATTPKANDTGNTNNTSNTADKKQPDKTNTTPPAATNVGRTDSPDPRIIGIAPGQRKPKLRREGEFLINRRGRLVASGDATHKMFVFDGDSAAAPEPPMFLLPCRLLENMESLAKDHGDRMVFQLSGQVFVYRGANYLLPTMMRPAVDKGNLRK